MLRSAATRSTLKQQWWRRVANPQIGAETLNETEGMEELPLSSQDAIDDDGDDSATRITYASLYLCTKCSYGVRAVRGVNERRIGRKQSERRRSTLFPILMRAYLRVAAAVCLWRSGSCSTSDATSAPNSMSSVSSSFLG